MFFTAFMFIAIIVVAVAAFAGVVYLIVRFVHRGDDIAVAPQNPQEGSGAQPKPPA